MKCREKIVAGVVVLIKTRIGRIGCPQSKGPPRYDRKAKHKQTAERML
jgi:hypothetical protein